MEGLFLGLGKGLGHLCIGCLSLYGELTDVLDVAPSYYDLYRQVDLHSIIQSLIDNHFLVKLLLIHDPM
jgi:hypothetical protein